MTNPEVTVVELRKLGSQIVNAHQRRETLEVCMAATMLLRRSEQLLEAFEKLKRDYERALLVGAVENEMQEEA